MKTAVMHGNTPRALAEAVRILKAGGILAFPSETVYGLAADAKNSEAVAKVFAAKGRPANNPLIVHCYDQSAAQDCVKGWNARCDAVAQAFWPGPLTLVLAKADDIPDIVTAGGTTVAVRVPSHITARALLARYKKPLAAPSANRSNEISPSCAEHVLKSLEGRIPLILDGGPCTVGLESTVLDLSSSNPRILRQGAISQSQIEAVLGHSVGLTNFDPQNPRSPGMMQRHYAPSKPVHLFDTVDDVLEGVPNGKIVLITFGESLAKISDKVRYRALPDEPTAAARQLYKALHWAEEQDAEIIYIQKPNRGEPWDAIRDRLSRML